jgi:cold shock protein
MFVMSTGTVKFFNEAKGFGFITPEDGGNDIFVHVTGIVEGQLNENDKVEYEVGEGQKGPCAVQVRKV